jgi:hypothetical protein
MTERKSGAHTPAKSTPTQWAVRWSLDGSSYPCIVNPSGDAELGTWMIAERVRWPAHAELICRAVNAFDPLVSALEQAVTLFEGDDECQTPGKDACMWLFDARAALSLAKDGTK